MDPAIEEAWYVEIQRRRKLIESGDRGQLFIGYLVAAALMAIAAMVEVAIGVDAEQETLEDVAEPLSAEEAAHA